MSKANDRLLCAAAELFAKVGFNGASTRDIARLAGVNEVTIYRYYPTKRDLFVAALEAKLSSLRIRADLLVQLATTPDARSGLNALLHLMTDALESQPELSRLLQYSLLEFGNDLEPLFRKHLSGVLANTAGHIDRWMETGQLRKSSSRIVVLAFIASVIGLKTYYPIVWGEPLPSLRAEAIAGDCADLWSCALKPDDDKSSRSN